MNVTTPKPLTRRTIAASAAAGAALLAACSVGGGGGPAPADVGPKEITWGSWNMGELKENLWSQTFRMAEQATGVKINFVREPAGEFWTKRQAEAAADTNAMDIMVNQQNWVVAGGLKGMFVDHTEYLRRDKVDTKQYYKADLIDTWNWKGKQWAIPWQSGGEVVYINKRMLGERGIKLPDKNWTYDEFLDICRRLTDKDANRFGCYIVFNQLHYMAATFLLNFGGKLLNATRDRALYGDDPNAIRGIEFDVDLHVRYGYTPTPEAFAARPPGHLPIDAGLVGMEIGALGRHAIVREALGAENLDFLPPPKGPTGVQTATVGGNSWSIQTSSSAKEAAWKALRWIHTREGMLSPQINAIAWPPLIWAASTPQWLDQFKGTHIADVARVWETAGHDLLVLPEGNDAWATMNAPLTQALRGQISARDALRESARQLNELFAKRPADWQ